MGSVRVFWHRSGEIVVLGLLLGGALAGCGSSTNDHGPNAPDAHDGGDAGSRDATTNADGMADAHDASPSTHDAAADTGNAPSDAGTACPPVMEPDASTCDGGTLSPVLSDEGCITGYDCIASCPEPPHPPAGCDGGDLVDITDDAGVCWLGAECRPYCADAGPFEACPSPIPTMNDAGTCIVSHECPAISE